MINLRMHSFIDVYDCVEWQKRYGPPPPPSDPHIETIKLLFCYDGFLAHNYAGAESVVPGSSICLSLPPWKRYKADNILVNFVMQDGLSSEAQKKFFDKIIECEFNPLVREGIEGPDGRVAVVIFGMVSYRDFWFGRC